MYAVDDGTGKPSPRPSPRTVSRARSTGLGWDIAVPELKAVQSGALAFSIDQQGLPAGLPPGHVPVPLHHYRRADAPVGH